MYFTRKGAPSGEVVLREHVTVSLPVSFRSVRAYKRVSCWIDSDTSTDDGRFRISGGLTL